MSLHCFTATATVTPSTHALGLRTPELVSFLCYIFSTATTTAGLLVTLWVSHLSNAIFTLI